MLLAPKPAMPNTGNPNAKSATGEQQDSAVNAQPSALAAPASTPQPNNQAATQSAAADKVGMSAPVDDPPVAAHETTASQMEKGDLSAKGGADSNQDANIMEKQGLLADQGAGSGGRAEVQGSAMSPGMIACIVGVVLALLAFGGVAVMLGPRLLGSKEGTAEPSTQPVYPTSPQVYPGPDSTVGGGSLVQPGASQQVYPAPAAPVTPLQVSSAPSTTMSTTTKAPEVWGHNCPTGVWTRENCINLGYPPVYAILEKEHAAEKLGITLNMKTAQIKNTSAGPFRRWNKAHPDEPFWPTDTLTRVNDATTLDSMAPILRAPPMKFLVAFQPAGRFAKWEAHEITVCLARCIVTSSGEHCCTGRQGYFCGPNQEEVEKQAAR